MPDDPELKRVISEVEGQELEAKKPAFFHFLEQKSAEEESLVEKENRGIIEMRENWSRRILFLIEVIVFFDIILVALYGWGFWKFDNPWVVTIVITDNFLKIIGLGVLITHNIFKKIY